MSSDEHHFNRKKIRPIQTSETTKQLVGDASDSDSSTSNSINNDGFRFVTKRPYRLSEAPTQILDSSNGTTTSSESIPSSPSISAIKTTIPWVSRKDSMVWASPDNYDDDIGFRPKIFLKSQKTTDASPMKITAQPRTPEFNPLLIVEDQFVSRRPNRISDAETLVLSELSEFDDSPLPTHQSHKVHPSQPLLSMKYCQKQQKKTETFQNDLHEHFPKTSTNTSETQRNFGSLPKEPGAIGKLSSFKFSVQPLKEKRQMDQREQSSSLKTKSQRNSRSFLSGSSHVFEFGHHDQEHEIDQKTTKIEEGSPKSIQRKDSTFWSSPHHIHDNYFDSTLQREDDIPHFVVTDDIGILQASAPERYDNNESLRAHVLSQSSISSRDFTPSKKVHKVHHSGTSNGSSNSAKTRSRSRSQDYPALSQRILRSRRRRKRTISRKSQGPLITRLARPNRQLKRYIHQMFHSIVNGLLSNSRSRRQQQGQERMEQNQILFISVNAIEILNSMVKDIIGKFAESADQLMLYTGRKKMNKWVTYSVLKMLLLPAVHHSKTHQNIFQIITNEGYDQDSLERIRGQHEHEHRLIHKEISQPSSSRVGQWIQKLEDSNYHIRAYLR